MRAMLTALAVLFAAAAYGQTAMPPAGETIDVSIVNVDVVVTDRRGNRVVGLTQDDFIVLEDGKPQAITNFAESMSESVAAANAESAAPKSAASRPRTFVLFFDRLPLKPWESQTLFAGLRDLMQRAVRPGDAVMIVSWARRQPLLRLPFTDDRARIEAALSQLENESRAITTGFDTVSREERDYERVSRAIARSRGYETGFSDSGPALTSVGDATLAFADLRAKMRSIRSFVEALSGDDSKKVMMLVTHRFSREAGLDAFLPRRSPLGPRFVDPRFDMRREIEDVIRTANANDVTVYTLHPGATGPDPTIGADATMGIDQLMATPGVGARSEILLSNELEALRDVAADTGGVMEFSAKEIAAMLPSVEDDLNNYYSLAYRVPASAKPRARKITVKTTDGSLLVRSRREFVEKSDDERIQARVTSSLLRDMGTGSIPITLEERGIAREGKKYRASFRVRIPVTSLMTGGDGGAFSVFMGWSGVFGEIGEGAKKTQTFQLRRGAPPEDAVFTYDFDLVIDGRTETVAVAVYDELSREYGLARLTLPPR